MLQSNKNKTYRGRFDHLSVSAQFKGRLCKKNFVSILRFDVNLCSVVDVNLYVVVSFVVSDVAKLKK